MLTDVAAMLANADFWVAVLRIATPLVLGTLGVLLCERAGVLTLIADFCSAPHAGSFFIDTNKIPLRVFCR